MNIPMHAPVYIYGVATISRLLKIIGLFCKRALQKRPIIFKETYNFKEPTNRSHPISTYIYMLGLRLSPRVSLEYMYTIHICTCTYTYTYTYIYLFLHLSIPIYLHVYTCWVYVFRLKYPCNIYTIYLYVRAHIHIYTHTDIHI